MISAVKKTSAATPNPLPKVPRVGEGLIAGNWLVNTAATGGKTAICVAENDVAAGETIDLLAFCHPDIQVYALPAWDCLPYDRVSPNPSIISQRLQTLKALEMRLATPLTTRPPCIVVTTAHGILQKLPPIEFIRQNVLKIKANSSLKWDWFLGLLTHYGYSRSDMARDAGDFAVRGDIIDLYPISGDMPVRIDVFGDTVERLRVFDPVTQRTISDIPSFDLMPMSECVLTSDTIADFKQRYRLTFGTQKSRFDPLFEAVSEGRWFAGLEHWGALLHPNMVSLEAYLGEGSDAAVFLGFGTDSLCTIRSAEIQRFYDTRLEEASAPKTANASGNIYNPLPPNEMYFALEDVLTGFSAVFQFTAVLDATKPSKDSIAIQSAPSLTEARVTAQNKGQQVLFDAIKGVQQSASLAGKHTILCFYSEGSKSRFEHMAEDHDLDVPVEIANLAGSKRHKTTALLSCLLPIENGIETDSFVLLTEQDIFGQRVVRRRNPSRKKAESVLLDFGSLDQNSLVVHDDHGIGRFVGLETIMVGDAPHDCLKLMYAGDDRLYVPVENIDVLTKYGEASENAHLDKLGGSNWQARKAKVKRDLLAMAEGLMKIAAERMLHDAPTVEGISGLYDDFVSRFPYVETEDQLQAIEDVRQDLQTGHPMDRLVCGDVGFGKTEVALRAAFLAASSGLQVAVVVPTTLLSRQHFRNFHVRFQDTALKVAQLSRLVTPKEAKVTKELMQEGKVDIVIGTHALLAKDVAFKNLGLVIVDEEQHFGVKQKERLKELKSAVHMLTLTATPIPRTLQMGLAGVRELSLITTPPVDRLAVRTFVMPYDGMIVREALMREHGRGGQSFYVCPRVKDLDMLQERLKTLVPELSVQMAHGQMTPTELDDRMTAFDDGRFDVLLATNIIESGLDIPRANTMIMHRADMFGLAQLYQLRGRVGRSKDRGYAYLTYPAEKTLTKDAAQRLKVIETLDNLGAGFQLASHDLDIRGAGNLLGDDQSGHIKEVGVELYQSMLADTIKMLRAEAALRVKAKNTGANEAATVLEGEATWSPSINIGLPVLIPEIYVPDLGVRMELYRQLGGLKTAESVEEFGADLIDRFGKYPEEVRNLMDTVLLKILCRAAFVARVDAGQTGAILHFHNNSYPKPDRLVALVQKQPDLLRLRPDNKLVYNITQSNPKIRLKAILKLISALAKLSG